MTLRKTNHIITFYYRDYSEEYVHFVNMLPGTIVIVVGPPFVKEHHVTGTEYRSDVYIPVIYEGDVGYMFDDNRSEPFG